MKRKFLLFIPIGIGIATVIGCKKTEEVVKEGSGSAGTSASSSKKYQSIDVDYLDRSTRPQDDFFQFANGTWIQNNPVPPSESRWGSFNELEKSNNEKLTKILENAKNNPGEKGSMNQILGDYYASYTNSEKREVLGLSPIQADLDRVERMNSKKDLASVVAEHHIAGIGSLFGFGVGQDLKDVDKHIAYFGQGGISLPNKDYYSAPDKEEILVKFQEHIHRIGLAMKMEEKDAKQWAAEVVDFEKILASQMMAPAELRIPEKTYNKMHKESLVRKTGSFDLETYFVKIGIPSFDSVVVGQPEFAALIQRLVDKTDLPKWKAYLKWKVVDHYAGHLNNEFVKLNFDFYGGVLSGKTEMKPINERAIREITGMPFSELLGKAFVAKHYSEAAKERVNTMVDNLLIVFEERIKNLTWMSDDTKKQAQNKLASIGRKLGYPDKWEDFSSLSFTADNYIGNIKESSLYAHKKNMSELLKPVDKDEWGMPAHMVNAYYHPLLNEIAFPAGIMQAPFFSDNYEDAVNYGRIGMVIGHEFTHGFDDMGSKFAADGSFTNWWTADDRKLFEERTAKLGQTFAGFCPVEGHCVNPDLTMGENIADLGGLTLAYHAYMRTKEFKDGKTVDGFTPSQRFFIAYAQLWKINYTEEELKNRIANDPHSPGMYRVNGPLMNCPEFFEAFDVKEEDPMRNSEDKISRIW